MERVHLARRNVAPARLVLFVTFLDLFIQFPVVAPYARQLGASATNLVGNLAAGIALDRWGRRRPVASGLLGDLTPDSPGAPFLVGGALALVIASALLALGRRARSVPDPVPLATA